MSSIQRFHCKLGLISRFEFVQGFEESLQALSIPYMEEWADKHNSLYGGLIATMLDSANHCTELQRSILTTKPTAQ